MVSILLRFLFLILGLWLLRQVLGKIMKSARPPGMDGNASVAPNNMVKDPVCGMYMDSRLAVRLENRKQSYYFCSEECKDKYLSRSGEEEGMRNAPPM
jgi:YHS domain-containing protein